MEAMTGAFGAVTGRSVADDIKWPRLTKPIVESQTVSVLDVSKLAVSPFEKIPSGRECNCELCCRRRREAQDNQELSVVH